LKHLIEIRSLLREPVLRLLVLTFLFVSAFYLRLYGIYQPPMEFAPVRQYHGALLARGFYEWWTTGDFKTVPPDGIIEPPILELIASFAYLVVGGEHLWIPRLLSAVFWMVGGVFLYLIAKRIVSPNAAVFSVFFYLFVPYSVFASRAFMPDPLMIMLLLASIFTILRYHEQSSIRRLIIAAIASSLAIFVKPGICLFQVFGAFVSLAVYREGVRRSLISPHLLVFTVLSILPTGLYYIYGTVLGGFLQEQTSRKVVPELLLEASFWEGWLGMIWIVVGYVAIVAALFGILALRRGLPRALMFGLWSGYFLYGLSFTFHIHTHTYYSLQLIPVVALSLGPLADLVMKSLNRTVNPNDLGRVGLPSYAGLLVLALSISVLGLSLIEQRQTVSQIAQQERTARVYTRYVATFQAIGEVVNHSHRTLVLYGDYQYALMYHGRLLGETWPSPIGGHREKQEISTQRLFHRYSKKFSPEYLISSRGWLLLDEELRGFLTDSFPIAAQGDDYIVFDLRRKEGSM
jgi:4-amino-4-deoxy-L-arabinose transferase-like glycosyltransferase